MYDAATAETETETSARAGKQSGLHYFLTRSYTVPIMREMLNVPPMTAQHRVKK